MAVERFAPEASPSFTPPQSSLGLMPALRTRGTRLGVTGPMAL